MLIKRARVAILISDEAEFRERKIIRNKEKHYIMMKELIHQEDITNLNVYPPNNRASKYVRQN